MAGRWRLIACYGPAYRGQSDPHAHIAMHSLSRKNEILSVLQREAGRLGVKSFDEPWADRAERLAWRLYLAGLSLLPVGVWMYGFGGRFLPLLLAVTVQILGLAGLLAGLVADVLRMATLSRAEVHSILARHDAMARKARALAARFPGFDDWDVLHAAVLSWKDHQVHRLGFVLAVLGIVLSFCLSMASQVRGCDATGPFDAMRIWVMQQGAACSWHGAGALLFCSGLAGALLAYRRWRRAATMAEILGQTKELHPQAGAKRVQIES